MKFSFGFELAEKRSIEVIKFFPSFEEVNIFLLRGGDHVAF